MLVKIVQDCILCTYGSDGQLAGTREAKAGEIVCIFSDSPPWNAAVPKRMQADREIERNESGAYSAEEVEGARARLDLAYFGPGPGVVYGSYCDLEAELTLAN